MQAGTTFQQLEPKMDTVAWSLHYSAIEIGRYNTCLHHWHQKIFLASKQRKHRVKFAEIRWSCGTCWWVWPFRNHHLGEINRFATGRKRKKKLCKKQGSLRWMKQIDAKNMVVLRDFPCVWNFVWVGISYPWETPVLGDTWNWLMWRMICSWVQVNLGSGRSYCCRYCIVQYQVPQDYMQMFGGKLSARNLK